MEIGAVIVELAPNCEGLVDKWVNHLNRNKQEVVKGLIKESVKIESYFKFSLEGKRYLIGYMRAESLQMAKEQASGEPLINSK